MKHLSLILFLIVFAIAFSSCKVQNPRYFNSPSTHAPAYLEKKGDSKISANISILPESEYPTTSNLLTPNGERKSKTFGFEGSAAYAVSDNFMVSLGGLHTRERDLFTNNDILQTYSASKTDYRRNALDLGLGAIIPIDNSKIFIFNPIVGMNLGRSESRFANTSDTIKDNRVYHFDGNYWKLYLAPNLNFHFHKNFKMSLVTKFSVMKYGNIDSNYPTDAREFLGINKLQQDYLFLFEPAHFFQIGFNNVDWLKLDLGITASIFMNAKNMPERLRTRNLQFSVGFSIYP